MRYWRIRYSNEYYDGRTAGQIMLPRLTERVLPSASGKMIDPAFVRSFISDVGLYDIGL